MLFSNGTRTLLSVPCALDVSRSIVPSFIHVRRVCLCCFRREYTVHKVHRVVHEGVIKAAKV